MNEGVIGRIASTGQASVCSDTESDWSSIQGNELTARKDIHGFNGQPIMYQHETLGVIAQYNRIPTPEQTPEWLRIFADHIGAAIVNARAPSRKLRH